MADDATRYPDSAPIATNRYELALSLVDQAERAFLSCRSILEDVQRIADALNSGTQVDGRDLYAAAHVALTALDEAKTHFQTQRDGLLDTMAAEADVSTEH